MPTYAYRCTECGNAFDIYQSFDDAALTECEKCGGKLRKVFGNLGVTFSGSGFYRTDSRAAAPQGSGGQGGGASSGSSGASGSGSSGGGGASGGGSASSGSSSSGSSSGSSSTTA